MKTRACRAKLMADLKSATKNCIESVKKNMQQKMKKKLFPCVNRNETELIFKRISYAIITSYPIKFFQQVHFLRKLSKPLLNMTDFYATLYFSANFSRIERLKQQRISQAKATAIIFKGI